MNNPLISIVVICYNRRDYLQQTMESVFAQTYSPVEVVILDDGSTDNTYELIATYGNKVRYVWQENQGVVAARNAGCRLAEGEFVAFQDDDDLMVPDRIVTLYEALRRYPSATVAVGDCVHIDVNGNLTGRRSRANFPIYGDDPVLIKDAHKAMILQEVDPKPHTTLFRKSAGDRIGWFDNRFIHAASDTDFFARCGQLGPIVYVPKVVSYYRRGHEAITSKDKDIIVAYSRFLLLEKHLNSLGIEQQELRKKLETRLLMAMKKIAFCESKGQKLPDSIQNDYVNRGLALLGITRRLSYRWSFFIKFPIRKMIRSVIPQWKRI